MNNSNPNTTTCPGCENITQYLELNSSKVCYPWVAKEFIGRNYTLDDVNSVVMKRNIPGIVFLGICIVLGLIGNGHVLFVFSKRKYTSNYIQDRIHANYRIFVLWLSILSVVQCAVVSPLLIVYLLYPVTYPSNVLCKFFRFIIYFIPETMSLTLVAIAVDRYLVICRTFENKLTSRHSRLMCTATVIVSLILTWPAPIVFGNGKTETGIPGLTGLRCYLEDESIVKIQQYYQTLLVLIFFIVMLVLFILYSKVSADYKKLLRFRRTSRRYSTSTPEALKRNQAKQEQQRVWIYGSVTICYVVCSLPYHILAILFFAKTIVDCDMSLAESQMFYLFIWSYFSSPVIYPIIYGFQDDGFRYSVQGIYRHSKNSLKKYLFDNKSSSNDTLNGSINSGGLAHSNSQICTQETENGSSKDLTRAIKYKGNGERKSELKDIITSIAAITLNVNELVIQEDINKNSLHI